MLLHRSSMKHRNTFFCTCSTLCCHVINHCRTYRIEAVPTQIVPADFLSRNQFHMVMRTVKKTTFVLPGTTLRQQHYFLNRLPTIGRVVTVFAHIFHCVLSHSKAYRIPIFLWENTRPECLTSRRLPYTKYGSMFSSVANFSLIALRAI